ncbi:hypothetical protein, conserved [Leishmania tarentolae]|uniref:Dynamin-type G domain-containing protein n=1 Tax=Leishmania tarentolae TaxID=5689 RepID=A0A640KT33_LEITA|nr:hypothetical protein, conserved [Leishmania tarentolae]
MLSTLDWSDFHLLPSPFLFLFLLALSCVLGCGRQALSTDVVLAHAFGFSLSGTPLLGYKAVKGAAVQTCRRTKRVSRTLRSSHDMSQMQEALKKKDTWDRHLESTLLQVSHLYTSRIEPVEALYKYNVFRPTWFAESIKQKLPFVTFLGPFSSGKSSFINYLLQGNYLPTGPQPVTDKFTVVMYGEQFQKISGRVLMSDSRLPYRGLSQFGDTFGEFFGGVVVPHPILRSVSFVDTPGILEASGDMHSRRYNYTEVCRWFVEKSDLVFFLFDPTKLDAGSELRQVFKKALLHKESKLRIVMNKADSVTAQELMRVYGSLYWNLSNLVRTTEPPRLYVSSFWDQSYQQGTDHSLFEKEKEDLLYELIITVPMQSLDRRVTSMIRRASDVLLFALICATYRTRLPTLFGKSKAKERFFDEYKTVVKDLASRYHASENDFPQCEDVRAFLTKFDSKDFPDVEKLEKRGWIELLRSTIEVDLPRLLQPLKEYTMSDPQERRDAIILQRKYMKTTATAEPPSSAAMVANAEGTGAPSSSPKNVVSSPASVTPAVSNASCTTDLQAQMMMMMQMLTAQQQQASGHSNSPASDVSATSFSNDQIQVTMKTMMSMMKQQMGQQPSQQQQ